MACYRVNFTFTSYICGLCRHIGSAVLIKSILRHAERVRRIRNLNEKFENVVRDIKQLGLSSVIIPV
jgi:hypothetical protein